MESIKELFELDIISLIIGIFIILSSIISMVTIVSKFLEYIGKPLKWIQDKDKDHQLLITTATALAELQDKQKEDVINSIKHDEAIREDLESVIKLLEENVKRDNRRTVATLRSTLYRLHSDFMSQGCITREGLKTFTECGTVYEEAGGDDIYHHKLRPEILNLPIQEEYINER